MPQLAGAQVQPHRAEYSLHLGIAANAPRIGNAIQDISSGCATWRIERDIAVQIPLTTSWNVSGASKLDGEEQSDGGAFRYHSVQMQNGVQYETRGKVRRAGNEIKGETDAREGHQDLIFPASTLLPVSALNYLITRLRAGATTTSMAIFAGEVSDVYQVDVEEVKASAIRAAPRVGQVVQVPARSWPVAMTFRKESQPGAKPIFTMNGSVFETGVLDRLTIDAGIFTITADLQTLAMHERITCPKH